MGGGIDRYARRFKDSLFKARMQKTLGEFNAYKRGGAQAAGVGMYKTETLTVRNVAHFAEVRYGFHFKDTDVFGLYGVCYGDAPDGDFTDDQDRLFTVARTIRESIEAGEISNLFTRCRSYPEAGGDSLRYRSI